MGESDRYTDYKPSKTGMRLGDDNNALVALFAINGILFLLLLLIQVSYSYSQRKEIEFYQEVLRWFALPGNFGTFIKQPWSLFSFMFSDSGMSGMAIVRFASNMIWLWGFGSLFQQIVGNQRLIPVYLYGGILGGLAFLMAHTFSSSAQSSNEGLLGANTAIMAIAMAATVSMPKYRFFQHIGGGIPLWVLMAIYIGIDLSGVVKSGPAYSFAHLGGATAGFIYIVLLRRGTDAGHWMLRVYKWLMNLYAPKKISREKIKEKVFYETGGRKPFTKTALITQQKIDEILDKINQKGFDYLSKEEKDILKRAAEDEPRE
ncbi:MAG TPA: rhomboid family intramembrane serine protease [Ferruginibacter sp.]|nr:rhomboid family intramembrane serine protease [Ferruginibacter sp.]HRE62241.1 rhomboid family intramembrane serine protease [Ferruginibacter sp.]